MLSMSQPLNVWAPSSAMLRSKDSSIGADDFLRYVEAGRIRVFAREDWLAGRDTREPAKWPEPWDEEIDGTFRDHWEDGKREGVAPEERRAIGLGAPSGLEWATDYLGDRPDEVVRLTTLLRSSEAEYVLPAQTLRSARKFLEEPTSAAIRVLQEAYNHGSAFRDSRSDAPFLLDNTDRTFIEVLAQAPASARDGVEARRVEASASSGEVQAGELAGQLADLLHHLDIHAGRELQADDVIKDFIEGEGHDLLVAWTRGLCEHIKRHPTTNIRDYVVERLRADVDSDKVGNWLSSLRRSRDVGATALAGALITGWELIREPKMLAFVGAGVAAYPALKGLVREVGLAPADFSGEQWPFLYTFGTQATGKQIERVQNVLDAMKRRRG
jgi:hypothetical protein